MIVSSNALYKYERIPSLDTSQQNYCCDCVLNHCNYQNPVLGISRLADFDPGSILPKRTGAALA